ncbi:damage-inducible protein DinB [Acinetobacter sp. ANC 4635]|uniref:DinB family protein n=1 Tax=Acinetobacter sp. ANC 4635 TaxID=2529846 RepID=UPI001039AE27|nr:DinB family protein [Acinetobacter sp. ANC 4635]TCB33583.1 damage-inducible protein DinB [Acinetobacter sp. ANC 4635]
MNLESLQLLARYNFWATTKLSQSLADVTDADFYRDSGLFFQSILGTLNHLLLGEHELWFPRFAKGYSPTLQLNTIVEDDRQVLIQTLQEKTLNWITFLNELDPQHLAGNLNYQTSTGQPKSLPYAATLVHVFNHGTHHRGQISAALTAMGYACPELDLVYMLVEEQQNLQ